MIRQRFVFEAIFFQFHPNSIEIFQTTQEKVRLLLSAEAKFFTVGSL